MKKETKYDRDVEKHRNRSPGRIGGEEGMVLVAALLLITVLVILGSTGVMTTTTDMKIAGNFREGVKALYDSEAGVHYAIALIRTSSSGVNLPPSPTGTTTTPSITPPTGFSFNNITLVNLGSDQYRLSARGNASLSAQKDLEVKFTVTSLVPAGADGAMAMYGSSPMVNLRTGGGGGANIDGHNYPLPTDFSCSGSHCRTTPAAAAVPGLYTAVAPTITGNTGHLDGNPAQQTGGGSHTDTDWRAFVDYVINNNLYTDNVLGTRAAPLITRIPSGSTLGGNMDGAGIIIVDNGGTFDVGGTGHFEGLVILRGTGTFTGHGTGNIFGSTITIDHAAKTADLNGTVDILYSSQALSNLSNIGSLNSVNIIAWKDTSLQ